MTPTTPEQARLDATAMVGERAELIARLIRKADAWDHLQPGATRLNACRQAADMLKADAKAQQVAVPDGWVMAPTETLLDIKNRVNTLATLSLKAERYSLGREIKQAIADMLAAAQGAKPVAQQVVVAVPDGFVLVPIEPTLEMMLQMPASSNSLEWKEYYAGMLHRYALPQPKRHLPDGR